MKSVASMAVSLPSRRGAAHLARSRSLKGSARRAAAHLARPRSLKGSARMLRCVAVADEEAIVAEYLKGTDVQRARAYSPAVVTDGGRTVWLAGQIATVDSDGRDISGDFEAQTRRVFAIMDHTLRRAGGTLADLVTMTVFIKDPRHGDRFVELRRGL